MTEPSDEWCEAYLKAMGDWVEPYDPPVESGVQTDMEITPEQAAEWNTEEIQAMRKGFAAANAAMEKLQ